MLFKKLFKNHQKAIFKTFTDFFVEMWRKVKKMKKAREKAKKAREKAPQFLHKSYTI